MSFIEINTEHLSEIIAMGEEPSHPELFYICCLESSPELNIALVINSTIVGCIGGVYWEEVEFVGLHYLHVKGDCGKAERELMLLRKFFDIVKEKGYPIVKKCDNVKLHCDFPAFAD